MSQTGALSPVVRETPPRPRISQRQRQLIWQHIDKLNGIPRHCYIQDCPRLDLQLDHKDGNKYNNNLDNFQPSCPTHQKTRTVVSKTVSVISRAQERVENADARPGEGYEVRTAVETKPAFRAWVIEQLVAKGEESYDWLMLNGAEKYKISQITTDRYLETMCSETGILDKRSQDVGTKMVAFVRLKDRFWSTAGARP